MTWEFMDQLLLLSGAFWPPDPICPYWLPSLGAGIFVMMVGTAWSDLLGGLSNKKQLRLAEVLKPYYDLYEIEQATQNYIPTRYRKIGPDSESSPEPSQARDEDSQQLIPYLLDAVDTDQQTHFLILADSGIGKTTFMLNLFQTCAFDKKYQHTVELFPLRDPNTMSAVGRLKQRSDTFLLLDGLNEDPEAIVNYETRLAEVIKQTQGFAKVIITCRTRFFSNELHLPIEAYLQQPLNGTPRPFTCIYLSTFSTEEVRRYIKKKYSVWNRNKRRRAMEIIEQAPRLMEQPLLLSFAEELLDGQRSYQYTFQVYEDLVATWIARTAYPQPANKRVAFQKSLYDLMVDLSIQLYHKHHGRERLFLSEEEVRTLVQKHNLRPEELQADGRSLLNYYTNQGYKFTHNSIMEYFLAQEAYYSTEFLQQVSFAGLDQAQRFLLEMIIANDLIKVEGGHYLMGKSDQQVRKQVDDFLMARYPVTVGQYQVFCVATDRELPEAPAWGWEFEAPILKISWEDAQAYCRWLSTLTGHLFRLPTEAEWEFAARGGRKNRRHTYAGHKSLNQVGWFGKNSERKTHPVGQKQPNELGIYDLSGSVWEWCQDWYILDHSQMTEELPDEQTSPGRSIRGGSWLNHESSCRVEMRGFSDPENRSNIIGFRVIAEMPTV